MAQCIYFQTTAADAIDLQLLSENDWQALQNKLSASEKSQLEGQLFAAKAGDVGLLFAADGRLSRVLVGKGQGDEATAMAQAATRLPQGTYKVAQELSEFAKINWALAQYRFERYKRKALSPRHLLINAKEELALTAMVDAVFLVRDLINMPANDMAPQHVAEVAQNLATAHKARFKQWVGDELLEANFPAVHAVGRASAQQPRLIELCWGDSSHPKVTLVGKGVCFDSGGLDIKSSSSMRLMKKDMGGAAQVLGLARWIMTMKLPLQLQVLIPAVENAVGSDAFRPGDVLTMRNGLTVEIDNTDAEGRLVLADALAKACEDKAELIIDFATLTGAARVAVGTEISAMFTDDEQLASALQQASQETQDALWRLPLFDGYNAMLDSSIADLINSPDSSYAGATTAALFLKYFVDKNIPWVHFDIMAWNIKSKPGRPIGGEAMGIRAVAHYLLQRFGKMG